MKRKQSKKINEVSVVVPCPMWLRKRMVRNLCIAATGRTGPKKAKKALRILKDLVLEGEEDETSYQPVGHSS